jgi:hypothetical protein
MFNKTFNSIKTLGKDSLSILKSLKDDICQEIDIVKEFKQFRKDKLNPKPATSTKPNARTRKTTKS